MSDNQTYCICGTIAFVFLMAAMVGESRSSDAARVAVAELECVQLEQELK